MVIKVNGQDVIKVADGKYSFANASKVGSYTITAETAENDYYYAGFNSTTFEVIKHNSTAIHFVEDVFVINVTSNTTVNVTINGKSYSIGENGVVDINTAELEAGEYIVVATVYENAKYNGNVTNATFKVVKYNASIDSIIANSTVFVGENTTINVVMENVTSGKLIIEVNG